MEYNIDTKVKFITSDLSKSPVLANNFGSLKDLLKVVLTEGFNEKSITSLRLNTVTGLFDIILPLNHGFNINTVITVSGSTESRFNKNFRIVKASGTTLSIFLEDESVAEATGDLKIKVAPLGYTIPYENEEEGVICFKNKSLKSPAILKVIDKLPPNGYSSSWAKYARVVAGQQLDSSGDFVDNFKTPYISEYPNVEKTGNGVSGATGIHGFAKWDYAITPEYSFTENGPPTGSYFPTNWRIIGDDKTFYIMIQATGKSRYSYNLLGFGNYISENKAETSNICLQARHGYLQASQTWIQCLLRSANNFGALNWDYSGYILTNIYGSLSNQVCRNVGMFFSSNNWNRPWLSEGVTPNTYLGALLTSKLSIKDAEGYIRGVHRGLEVVYGKTSFPDLFTTQDGSLILYVQSPTNTATSENTTQPLLFSLKDWVEVE